MVKVNEVRDLLTLTNNESVKNQTGIYRPIRVQFTQILHGRHPLLVSTSHPLWILSLQVIVNIARRPKLLYSSVYRLVKLED